jgi:hypothetical protein
VELRGWDEETAGLADGGRLQLEDGGEQLRQVKLRKCGELRRCGRVEKARLE